MRRAFFLLLASGVTPAWASQSVTIPAYVPAIGQEITFESRVETVVESRGAFPIPCIVSRGVFTKSMTVTARGDGRLTTVWRLGAEPPASATGALPLNDLYRQTLAVWGLRELAIDIDPNGAPAAISDLPALREGLNRILKEAVGSPVPRNTVLGQLLERFEADPLIAVGALVPEATVVALPQAAEAMQVTIGGRDESETAITLNGQKVPGRLVWTYEAVGPESVTLSWREEMDPAALARAQQDLIAREVAAVERKEGRLSPERLAELRRVSTTRTGRATVSLKHGATLEATEIAEVEAAGQRQVTVLRVTRITP
jgi:hypothetical protein